MIFLAFQLANPLFNYLGLNLMASSIRGFVISVVLTFQTTRVHVV